MTCGDAGAHDFPSATSTRLRAADREPFRAAADAIAAAVAAPQRRVAAPHAEPPL